MDAYIQITFATFFGGIAGGTISYFTKLYFTEKIKASIKREYDDKLELLKSDLKKNEIAISSALNSQNQGSQIGQKETLEALKMFWEQYLMTRQAVSPIDYIDWYVLEHEFNDLFTANGNENVARDLQNVDFKKVKELNQFTTVVEKLRPFLNTNLWLYFIYFQTFTGRIIYLYGEGVEKRKISHWKADASLLRITKDILSEEEYAFITSHNIGTIKAIQSFIEQKILVEISKILTGHIAAENAYSQALRLIELNKEPRD